MSPWSGQEKEYAVQLCKWWFSILNSSEIQRHSFESFEYLEIKSTAQTILWEQHLQPPLHAVIVKKCFKDYGTQAFIYISNSLCQHSFNHFLDILAMRTVDKTLVGVCQVAGVVQLPHKSSHPWPAACWQNEKRLWMIAKLILLIPRNVLPFSPPRVPSVLSQCSPIKESNTEQVRARDDHLK